MRQPASLERRISSPRLHTEIDESGVIRAHRKWEPEASRGRFGHMRRLDRLCSSFELLDEYRSIPLLDMTEEVV